MAKQVWWYRFMFQILVAIFWRVFLRHRTFISIIWSWAGQSSTQDGSKRWKKLVSFPMVFTCCVSCNPKITLCQYYWCKDECISCHLGCFLFEVPLIELVRNANFAKHLDLDAQKRFEMKWWRWWMMFLVLCSVTSNLNVGWQFFVPNDEQIRKGANCCSWLRGGALNHWSLDCLRPWCQCRLCWWWKINDLMVKG